MFLLRTLKLLIFLILVTKIAFIHYIQYLAISLRAILQLVNTRSEKNSIK